MKAAKLRIGEMVLLAITLVSFVCSTFYYPRFADATVPGFRAEGQGDPAGYSNLVKTFGISSFMLALLLLYIVVPKLRHRLPNKKFSFYDRLMIWLFAFYLIVQYHELRSGCAMSSPLDGFVQVKVFSGIAFASLFLILGDMCSRLKPSWPVFTNRWMRRNPQALDHTITSIGWWLKATGVSSLTLVFLPTYLSVPLTGICLLVVEFYMFVYPHYARFRERRRLTSEGEEDNTQEGKR